MGLFQKLGELFSSKRYIERAMKEIEEEQKKYLTMTSEELSALSDEDLHTAAICRVESIIEKQAGEKWCTPDGAWVSCLSEVQRSFHAVDWFLGTVSLVGLRDTLFNKDDALAAVYPPLLSESLQTLGMTELHTIWESFAAEQSLELSLLAYTKKPSPAADDGAYEGFDRRFAELPTQEELLVAYVRSHLAEF